MRAKAQFATQFEVKAVHGEQRIISGWAAVAGNLDRVGDIIDSGAFQKTLSEKPPTAVSVFIGHKTSDLPVGVCQAWQFDGKGLFTETKVFDGPDGDRVLGCARGLMAVGRSLGLSVGYRTRDSKMERGPQGKMIRRLLDIDVMEYSFADSTAIANEQALVTSVKQAGGRMPSKAADTYHIEQRDDGWHVMDDGDGDDLGTFDSREAAQTAIDALLNEEHEDDDEGDKGRATTKLAWTTAYINDLPDASFLLVEDGAKDEAGKTVPRSNRHFPYKDASGKVDLPHLRNAIARIPQSDVPHKDTLQARAQRLLAEAQSGKTLDWGAEWADDGAPLTVLAVGYALLDLAEKLAATQAHQAALDLKIGKEFSNKNLEQLHKAMAPLDAMHADACKLEGDCPRMTSGAKVAALYRRRLQLLAV